MESGERRVERGFQRKHRRLKPEEHRGIVAHRLIVYHARPFHVVAEPAQHVTVARPRIAAQVGQRRTLPYSDGIAVSHCYQPYFPFSIHAAARSRRLLEMEHALLNIYFHV